MEDKRLSEQDVERIVDRIVSKRVSKWADPKFISRTPPDANQVWQWSDAENAFVPATLSGTSSGHTIKENGTAVTSRANLDFIDAAAGAGLVTDDGTDTEVNLSLYVLEAEHASASYDAGHHAAVTLGAGSAAELALSGQELTLAAVLTPTEHDTIADGSPHHAAVTASGAHTIAAQAITAVAATDALAAHVELATTAETTTGTDAGRAVTPDGLAGSTFGKRLLYVKVMAEDTALTTGDGKAYVTIPEELNGMNLVGAHAAVYTVSSSGTPTVQIHNLTDTVDMLSTLITIDASEFSSYTAVAPPAINGAADDVATGDRLRIDVDVAGTGTTGLDVILSFQLP